MTNEAAEWQGSQKAAPVSAIFFLDGLVSPEHRSAVVHRVLTQFPNLSGEAQNALRQAVTNEEAFPPIGGFRRGQAARALGNSSFLLQEPLQQAVLSSDDLSLAVLRCWAESHQGLREAVENHLAGKGQDSSGLDIPGKLFPERWFIDQWKAEQAAFLQVCDSFDPDDAALMLCYISGRIPLGDQAGHESADSESALSAALAYLEQLPPMAAQWESEIPNFASAVSRIIEEKSAQLRWAVDFNELVGAVKCEFSDLLTFFEADPSKLAAERVSPESDNKAVLGLAQKLRSLLGEYRLVHERAPSIGEERERSQKRDELQSQIMETLKEIDDSYPLAAVQGQAQQQITEASGEVAALQSECSECSGLRDSADTLLAENQALIDEVEILKAEFFESKQNEDAWRLAYRSAMGSSQNSATETEQPVESVRAAVEMAKTRFRQEMLFAPNSESNVEDNPFNDPEKVWEALQWLATTYYASKMGRLRVTDFDQSIKEACGWWYKGDQGETTLSRYGKSYSTWVEGKRRWLAEHIGKGKTFDARYTIRIAFNWDRDKRQVVVGYIGRHQQTDAS